MRLLAAYWFASVLVFPKTSTAKFDAVPLSDRIIVAHGGITGPEATKTNTDMIHVCSNTGMLTRPGPCARLPRPWRNPSNRSVHPENYRAHPDRPSPS